jgi:hypothetical protein
MILFSLRALLLDVYIVLPLINVVEYALTGAFTRAEYSTVVLCREKNYLGILLLWGISWGICKNTI